MTAPSPSVRYGDGTLPIPASTSLRLEVPPAPPRRARPGTDDPCRALDAPIGAPPLARATTGARSALVAVSDATRATGAEVVAPAIVDRLTAAGVRRITFAIGSGLHRVPTPSEIGRILGPAIVERHEVVTHDPDDDANLVAVGRTSAGTPVRVHRALVEHDAVVLTGAVGFHYYAGFSGGRKAVVPGLAARETIVGNHLRAIRRDGTRHPGARAGTLSGNPVHRDMVEAAALVRPAFLVNTVMAERGGIDAVFAGHWRRAHEAACRLVRRTRTLRLRPRPVVVVSAGGAPHDIDLIQAHKALEAAFGAVQDGGDAILVARCPGGFGHPDFAAGLAHPSERAHVRALLADYRVYVQTALAWRRKLARCRVVLVSDLPPDTVRGIGAEPAVDLAEAVRIVERRHPRGTPGWLLPHGVRWRLEPDRPEGGSRA